MFEPKAIVFIGANVVFSTPPSSPSEYPCPYPNCGHISSRAHDLKRHYTKHFPPVVEELLDCQYEWCGRTGAHGFKREDHRKEHYRKVHPKESRYPKKRNKKGKPATNVSLGLKNSYHSVQTKAVDERPALKDKSIPSLASPEPSGLTAEAVATLEAQQPPKMNGSPPDQEATKISTYFHDALPSWSTTKTTLKQGIERFYNLVDELGAPVNKLSNKLKASIADANVETITPGLHCPSKVSIGPIQQKGLQWSGDIGMEPSKINELTPRSDDHGMLERSEGSLFNGSEAPLERKDRHTLGMIFNRDQTILASTSNYSNDYNLAILERRVLTTFQTREVGLHNALLKVEWDLLAFMKDQFRDNEVPNNALGSVVTISGSVQHAQATICAEYVKQNWTAHGLEILEALQVALDSPEHTSQARIDTSSIDKSMSSDNALSSRAELKFDISPDEVCVVIMSGTLDVILSAVSQLAWMGTALRTSADGRVQYCEAKLGEVLIDQEAEPTVFKITFVMSSLGEKDQSCWLPLFSNPVIARGFHIPERENGEQGLEIPLEIMAALGGARHVSEFDGGLVLKGYSAMFVPINCQQNSVQWHLICARGEDRISYREASIRCPNRVLLGELNHEKLSTTRTFLGWWKEAETHLATADVDYGNIHWSKAKEASSTTRLTGGNVGFSKIISAQMSFVLGAKDGPYHYSQQEPFQKTIDRAEKFPIVLYDQKDRRAWLVSALAVILHIIQLRNHNNPFVVGGNNVQISPLDPSRQGNAAREAVAKNKSLKLFDCETNEEKGYCFRDAILDTWSVLDGLMEQEAKTQATPGMAVHTTRQTTLYGWELMGVVEEERHLKHKAQVLEKTAGRWYDLVKDVDAVVLFASGLGDIIRPRSESAELCRKWRSLPKEKDYLAVCVPMLETFYAKAGHRQDHQYLTSAKLQWHLGSMLFEKCADIASNCCKCDRLQQVYHNSYGVFRRRTTPGILEANGCVVFGQAHHSLWGHGNIARRQNAVHTLPNTSIQNGRTIKYNQMKDDCLLSPPPTTTVSPEPREESNHYIRNPRNPPWSLSFSDHVVHAENSRRKLPQIHLLESEISDDEVKLAEDYAIYPKDYHPAFKHDRKSEKPRVATTQTMCTPEDECDVAHVRKCIPSSGKVQKTLAIRAEPLSFGPKAPEEDGMPQVPRIRRSGHSYDCSCTECLVVDFEPPYGNNLFGAKVETQHNSTKIAERRGRQRV